MAYREGGYRNSPIAIGAVLVALLIGAAYSALPLLKPFLGQLGLQSEQGAERALIDDPEAGRLFAEIKKSFPVEFGRIRKSLSENASKFDAKAMNEEVRRTVEAEINRNAHFVRQAPYERVEAMRRANLALAEQLQRDNLPVCADFAETGQVKDAAALPKQARTMVIDLAVARVQAIAAGRDHAVPRPAQPTPGDVEAMIAAMRQGGATEPMIALFIAGQQPAYRSPDMLCNGSIIMLRAIGSLPRESADRVLLAVYGVPDPAQSQSTPPPPPS